MLIKTEKQNKKELLNERISFFNIKIVNLRTLNTLCPVQTLHFTYAELNVNEVTLLFSLICIRFGS